MLFAVSTQFSLNLRSFDPSWERERKKRKKECFLVLIFCYIWFYAMNRKRKTNRKKNFFFFEDWLADPIPCVAFAVAEWSVRLSENLSLSKCHLILWGCSLVDNLFWCHAVNSKYSIFVEFEELLPLLREKNRERESFRF